MPVCKNDPTRNYKGNEPSPKGLGICAHAEKLNIKKKGKDGNMWIVVKTKNNIKRWVKDTSKKDSVKRKKSDNKIKKVSKKKSLTKRVSKKGLKKYDPFDFYNIKVISPIELDKYISKNEILKKINNKIKSEIEKQNINFYLVPLPMTSNGLYLVDFVNDYIIKYFNENYYQENGITLIIFMNNNLTLNLDKPITIQYNLDISLQQKVFDIFSKHLPYNYEWDGNSRKSMFINFKKQKNKIKSIKINKKSDYPLVYITGILEGKNTNLYDLGDFTKKTKEFKDFSKIENVSKFVENQYNAKDFLLIFYGIKDIDLIIKFFKTLNKKKILSFDSNTIKIKNLSFRGYLSENDEHVNNIYFDENNIKI